MKDETAIKQTDDPSAQSFEENLGEFEGVTLLFIQTCRAAPVRYCRQCGRNLDPPQVVNDFDWTWSRDVGAD